MESCTCRLPLAKDKAPPKAAPVLLVKAELITLTVDEIATMTNALPDATLPTFSACQQRIGKPSSRTVVF